MIFIAGLTPKTRILDDNPRRCPRCGLSGARLKRVDHYLTLFFIPVFPIRKGEPFVACDRCEGIAPPGGGRTCAKCGKDLRPDFRFCPFCGAPG
jgi:RNA polymerase subunit RPABC4/transcription elongation factor Spt4